MSGSHAGVKTLIDSRVDPDPAFVYSIICVGSAIRVLLNVLRIVLNIMMCTRVSFPTALKE